MGSRHRFTYYTYPLYMYIIKKIENGYSLSQEEQWKVSGKLCGSCEADINEIFRDGFVAEAIIT